LRRCFISRGEEARKASDHLPLIADFEITAQQVEGGHSHGVHGHAGAKQRVGG
jgi:hypothetical protein